MSKRTRRKKMKKFLSISKIILASLSLLAILSLLLPVVKIDHFIKDDSMVNGFNLIFGWNYKGELVTVKYTNFTFAGLLAIIFPIAGTVFALFKTKMCGVFSAACFTFALVVCAFMPNILTSSATEAFKVILDSSKLYLGVGAYIAIVLNGLMAILTLIKTFYK